MRNTLAILIILTASVLTPGAAQDISSIDVMVLGTFHFHKLPDSTAIVAPERQAEIRAVVRSLAAFRPTKVALEEVPSEGDHLDSLYTAYRAERHELTRNERQQLGFRLADRLGHERLYPIDYKHEWPMSAVVEYAEMHQPWFADYWEDWIGWAKEMALHIPLEISISERLRMWNDPETLAVMHGRYMRAAEVGTDSTYVGANLVAKWYRRNIHIFSNLTRSAEPRDRITVIIGAGHAPTLRRFVSAHPRMRLVEPLEYLPAGSAASRGGDTNRVDYDPVRGVPGATETEQP